MQKIVNNKVKRKHFPILIILILKKKETVLELGKNIF